MSPGPTTVTLRPYGPTDQALLARTESEFESFGLPGVDPHRRFPSSSFDDLGGLVVCAGSEAVGTVSWRYPQWGPNAASRCVMIGIGLHPSARGRGIGTRAQALLTELIFTHTAVHRVEACTELANLAEQRSLEKAGFTREGVIRESIWRQGRFRDQVIYSRLRTDPAA